MEAVASVLSYERGLPWKKIITKKESELRQRDLDAPESAPSAAERAGEWARALELSLISASLHDAILQLGLMTVADVTREFARVDEIVRTLSRLDPVQVVEENWPFIRSLVTPPRAEEPATVDTEAALRSARSLLLHCPIDPIERAAREPGVAGLAHRCRLAFDGLRAFVARHTHPQQEAIAAAGRVYAEGRASIDEVAAMLGLDVPDVVALLEEHGFRRDVAGLRLDDETRRARLARIREDRLSRRGEPAPSASHVARDVIASQRIEGVDARPWLRR